MATNPMQRRARNSFLLGALLMTLLLGAVIGVMFFLMMNLRKENAALQATTVMVLDSDVQSGAEVSMDNLKTVKVASAPENAVSSNNFQELKDDGTLVNKKYTAKIDLKAGTTLTASMLLDEGSTMTADRRKQEYNIVVLPMDIKTGDFIDIRLLLPNGQDFIVVSKKKVEIPQIAGVDAADTISVEMTEDEILTMSNAIVESYMINGSKIYATKLTDAGNQPALTPTYRVSNEVAALMTSEREYGNIVAEAWNGLANRLNQADAKKIREENINAQISAQEDATANEQTKMEESITKSQTSREEYLQSLAGGTTEN